VCSLVFCVFFVVVCPVVTVLDVVVDVVQERSSLGNAPPTYSEPVCMPDFSSHDEQQLFNKGITLFTFLSFVCFHHLYCNMFLIIFISIFFLFSM